MDRATSQTPVEYVHQPESNPALDRLWRVAGGVSVRTKILGIILTLVVVLGLGVTLQVRDALADTLHAELRQRAVSITRDLGARTTDLVLIHDLYALHELIRDTLKNNPDVRYAFVLDEGGGVLAHSFGDGFPDGLLAANAAFADDHHRTVTVSTDEGVVLDTAVPVFDGRAGMVRVGMSQRRALDTVDALTRQLLLTTLLVSAVGVAVAGMLTWVLARPIQHLAHVARQIGRGDFSPRVQRWADDEIGELADAFNAMAAGLQDAEKERKASERMRAQYVKGVIAAQEEERKRIARELHDDTSQSLTSLMIGLRTLGTSGDVETRQRAEELRDVAARTLDEVHNMALQLRPSVLDDLGLAAAIERYVADCRRYSPLQVDLAMHGLEARLPSGVETAIYRIVQESLTNVVRHARAHTASVIIERRDGAVRAVIEDDGCGFDPSMAGRREQRLGIFGMRERAELLNGRVMIDSSPGQGSSVVVEIPAVDDSSPPIPFSDSI